MTDLIEPKLNFHPGGEGLALFMGDLEAEIMEIIWEEGPITVKRAQYYLSKSRKAAYTTVMTVMSRMAEKHLLARSKVGHAFVYEPVVERNLFLNSVIKQVLEPLMEDFPEVLNRILTRLRKKQSKKKKNKKTK